MSPPFQAVFDPATSQPLDDSPTVRSLIQKMSFIPHPEGGFFVETDRDTLRIPSPFHPPSSGETRSASTTIHYLLTPSSPLGHFHRNRARTVHTLHKGRGRYVIIHADEVAEAEFPGGYEREGAEEGNGEGRRWTGKARVETFVVGQNVLAGERLQWIVPGGKYKASFLLPDKDGSTDSEEGLLISETVVPGFEYFDHDFMTDERLRALVTKDQAAEMAWMVRRS